MGSLDVIRTAALEQLRELAFAPSVQMQDVPRESLSRHLGFRKDDDDERDKLDKKLAQHARYAYHLQDGDSTTDESSDSEELESDDSSVSSASWKRRSLPSLIFHLPSGRFGSQTPTAAAKKRMSLLTGKYFDVPIDSRTLGAGSTRPSIKTSMFPRGL